MGKILLLILFKNKCFLSVLERKNYHIYSHKSRVRALLIDPHAQVNKTGQNLSQSQQCKTQNTRGGGLSQFLQGILMHSILTSSFFISSISPSNSVICWLRACTTQLAQDQMLSQIKRENGLVNCNCRIKNWNLVLLHGYRTLQCFCLC